MAGLISIESVGQWDSIVRSHNVVIADCTSPLSPSFSANDIFVLSR